MKIQPNRNDFIKKIHKEKLPLMIFLVIFTIGLSIFWNGFHSIDIAQNELRIEGIINAELARGGYYAKINLNEIDTNFNVNTLTQTYLNGIFYLFRGFFVTSIGAFGIGYFLRR